LVQGRNLILGFYRVGICTPQPAEQIDGGGVGVPVVMTSDNEYLVLRSDGTNWLVTV
jgi:hypothetical protein